MSEKSKWFDESPEGSLDLVILAGASGVSAKQAKKLVAVCEQLNKRRRIPFEVLFLLDSLAKQKPAGRLAHNMAVMLALLASGPVPAILPHGLTTRERKALLAIQKVGMDWELKAVAQGLFNLPEREQLRIAADRMFREERARPWRLEDE